MFLLGKDVSLHGAIPSKYVNVTDEKLRRRHGGEFDDVGGGLKFIHLVFRPNENCVFSNQLIF